MTQPDQTSAVHPREGVVAVIPRGGKLLVIRRSQLVRAPGRYCFPGGGMHPDETEPQALVRELHEELEIVVRPLRRLWTSVTPWSVALAWWLAEFDDAREPRPNPAEVESVHWLSVDEIRGLTLLLESNHQFLDALARGEFSW